MTLKKAFVMLDGFEETTVECVLDPAVRWNGWACPLFPRESVDHIGRAFAAGGFDPSISFVWSGDDLIVTEGDEEPYVLTPQRIDGQLYWPVGAHAWVWEEVSG